MFLTQTTVVVLSVFGLLLSASPITASPTTPAPALAKVGPSGGSEWLVTREEAGTPRSAKNDVGFDALYALFTKGLGAKLTQDVITKMVLDGPLLETPAMQLYVVEARQAVERDDQKAAFQAMRQWSAEVDRERGLSH